MPLYSIDPTIKQPAYLQLYRQIRQDITSGLCPYGSKLPSKRFLAAETGTSVITVQHAYDLLSDEGYIRSQERSGYYVCYKEGEIFPVASSELSHLGGDLSIFGGFSGAAEETQNDKKSNSPAVKDTITSETSQIPEIPEKIRRHRHYLDHTDSDIRSAGRHLRTGNDRL